MTKDSLAFLLSDVSRLLRRRFDARARLVGVTRAQWRALVTISRNEGVQQGALAELLEVEPITLCRMIDRLEEAELVVRRRDPGDRRSWRIHLTTRAHPLIEQLRTIADILIEEALDGVSDAARAELTGTLGEIRANLVNPELQEVRHG